MVPFSVIGGEPGNVGLKDVRHTFIQIYTIEVV